VDKRYASQDLTNCVLITRVSSKCQYKLHYNNVPFVLEEEHWNKTQAYNIKIRCPG